MFEQSVICAVGVVGVGYEILQGYTLGEQALLQVGDELGQGHTVAGVRQVGLHMANDAVGRVHGQATEVVECPRFAKLNLPPACCRRPSLA